MEKNIRHRYLNEGALVCDFLEMMSKRNRFEVAFDNKLRGQDEQAARDGKFRRISTTG
jgi:hypothetical protein